ncbi:MAG: flagellar biosynthesis anti-sigma factor FlgM [Sedimentisphaerales bacterium]|jgi:hypothetical protein
MVEKTEIFACGSIGKVILMSDCTRKNWLTEQRRNLEPLRGEYAEPADDLIADDDLLMEQILENMNGTPLGQVLKKIAVMPEVRKQKVLKVRRQLTEGRYNLTERLDLALEKVLDDLDI